MKRVLQHGLPSPVFVVVSVLLVASSSGAAPRSRVVGAAALGDFRRLSRAPAVITLLPVRFTSGVASVFLTTAPSWKTRTVNAPLAGAVGSPLFSSAFEASISGPDSVSVDLGVPAAVAPTKTLFPEELRITMSGPLPKR